MFIHRRLSKKAMACVYEGILHNCLKRTKKLSNMEIKKKKKKISSISESEKKKQKQKPIHGAVSIARYVTGAQ